MLDIDDAVITNINLDHSDVYPTLESYIETFQQFADGFKGNLFMLEDASHLLEYPRLHLLKKETLKFEHVFGEHNQKNATLVIALLEAYGDRQKIINALQSSKGIRRRMEVL